MSLPVYLDGFATLPLAPEARAAMLAAWDAPGNAGSPNTSGEIAAQTIDKARSEVAALIGAASREIIFTSGATEANNLALLGAATALSEQLPSRRRIVVSSIEHKAILEPASVLSNRGFELCIAPVDQNGRLDLQAFSDLATSNLLLASVMLVNNETGVIQPVREAAEIAHAAGGAFHSDAAQAAGKIDIDVFGLDIDYLSLSAHKCYGPMGIGALFVAAGAVRPFPLTFGGGQQEAIRPGTEPVALIAGFGAAAEVARDKMEQNQRHTDGLLRQLFREMTDGGIGFQRITGQHPVIPGSAAIRINGVDADALCSRVAPKVSISTGSACNSGQIGSSHVLASMGYSTEAASSIVRIFCHRYLDSSAIRTAAHHIIDAESRSRVATGEVRQ